LPGCTILVKQGNFERYELLYKAFGQRVSVMWDHRRNQRRRNADGPSADERRNAERRGPPLASWRGLGFVVVDR